MRTQRTPHPLATGYRRSVLACQPPVHCVRCFRPLRPGYAGIFRYLGQPERCPSCYERANGLRPDQGDL
jgi:hypothetical protein